MPSLPKYTLLRNVHLSIEPPGDGKTFLTHENYDYYHYCCDQSSDAGFGCGYRTIQTICSMLREKLGKFDGKIYRLLQIPSIRNIQEVLVKIGDKSNKIIDSRDWIGTVEGSYIFDELFSTPSYLIHISSGERISSKKKEIVDYFTSQGGLIFMGGDCDAAAKMIAGVHVSNSDEMSLLIVDPHCQGRPKDASVLVELGYVRWQHESEFIEGSFYNLCVPKIK